MTTRWGSEDRPSGEAYDTRWEKLVADGVNPHGEADFVAAMKPASVLDLGCGTGRVAIELARRGLAVVGVDRDDGFIERARAKAPALDWRSADLTTVDLGQQFDVVVMAGNVMVFLVPGTEAAALANTARHLAPGGSVVVGFEVSASRLPLEQFDSLAHTAGLSLCNRYATWDRAPYVGGNYAVSTLISP